MPFFQSSASPMRQGAIVIVWNERSRVLPLNGWVFAGLTVVVPLLAAILCVSAAYLVFHDELLAAMMTRQTDMQYSYEDRIAALGAQLDQQTISGNAERGTIDVRLRHLDETRDQLEKRTAAITGLVTRLLQGTAKRSSPDAEIARETSSGLRVGDGRQHSDLSLDGAPVDRVSAIERSWDRLAQHQAVLLADLAGPTMRDVARMGDALARSGLPLARWHLASDVGGPFVPLPTGTLGFDETIKLLSDAARPA